MSIEAMKFARDWIAEKPALRPCSAGMVVSMLTTAIAAAEKAESLKDASQAINDTNAVLASRYFELLKFVEACEKHGVTCQTFRHFVDTPCAECNCAPAAQPRDDGMPTSKIERSLRRMLAIRVGMPNTYFDDGEAQGTEHGIQIDFMREPVAHIDAKLRALNVARSTAEVDVADTLAGALKISRADAYRLMARTVKDHVRMTPIPPAGADPLDVAFAEGWNAACQSFLGGLPAQPPVVITIKC